MGGEFESPLLGSELHCLDVIHELLWITIMTIFLLHLIFKGVQYLGIIKKGHNVWPKVVTFTKVTSLNLWSLPTVCFLYKCHDFSPKLLAQNCNQFSHLKSSIQNHQNQNHPNRHLFTTKFWICYLNPKIAKLIKHCI